MMQKKKASSFLITIFFILPSCIFQIAYDTHVAFLIRKKATNVTKMFLKVHMSTGLPHPVGRRKAENGKPKEKE